MVLTDSCWALSMNEQVFTTITSASSALRVNSAPARASMPIITSLSTRFFGQPRLTNPTFCGRGPAVFSRDFLSLIAAEPLTARSFTGMQSFYFNIRLHWTHSVCDKPTKAHVAKNAKEDVRDDRKKTLATPFCGTSSTGFEPERLVSPGFKTGSLVLGYALPP